MSVTEQYSFVTAEDPQGLLHARGLHSQQNGSGVEKTSSKEGQI